METSEHCRWCLHISEAVNDRTSPVTIYFYIRRQSHINTGKAKLITSYQEKKSKGELEMNKRWYVFFHSWSEPRWHFSAFYFGLARKSVRRRYIVSRTPDYRQTLDNKGQTTSQEHQHNNVTELMSTILGRNWIVQVSVWLNPYPTNVENIVSS